MCSKFAAFIDVSAVVMIPEEVTPPDSSAGIATTLRILNLEVQRNA
jgi:hypothetical protein